VRAAPFTMSGRQKARAEKRAQVTVMAQKKKRDRRQEAEDPKWPRPKCAKNPGKRSPGKGNGNKPAIRSAHRELGGPMKRRGKDRSNRARLQKKGAEKQTVGRAKENKKKKETRAE